AMVKYGEHNRPAIPADRSLKDRRAFVQDLIEGFRYVGRRPRVSMLLAISAVTSLFGAPYISMTPVFARDIFHLGETGLALLLGMAGAGAFFGALFLAYLGDFQHKGKLVLGGAFSFAVCLICFFLSTRFVLSLVFVFFL